MAGTTWMNPDQVVFLTNRLIAFVEAQDAKTLQAFWTIVFWDFFIQWPTPESELVPNGLDADWTGALKTKKKKRTPAVTAAVPVPATECDTSNWVGLRRESIRNWYNNHGLNKGKRRPGKHQTVTLALQTSAPRVLSERNMYSKLYYEERVKPAVQAEIGDRKLARRERFAITNRLLGEIYDKEPESVKEEIRKAIEKDRQAKESEKEISTSVITANESFGPKEYLMAQSSLPDIIGDFLETMAKRTGWSFTVVGGGPDGAKNGNIRTISLHTGKDAYGQTFPKAIPDYVETVLLPYSKFLESVYRESLQKILNLVELKKVIIKAQAARHGFLMKDDKTAIPLNDALTLNKALNPNGSSDTSASAMLTGSLSLNAPDAAGTSTSATLPPTVEDSMNPYICPTSTLTTAPEATGKTDAYTFQSTTASEPAAATSTSTGMTDLSPNTYQFDFSNSFHADGVNQTGTHHYGNSFGEGQNLSFSSLLEMPLASGGDMTGGLMGWDTSQAGQDIYNASGAWTLPNVTYGSWGNSTFNDMASMNQTNPNLIAVEDPTIHHSGLANVTGENPVVASEVIAEAEGQVAGEIEKAPELPIALELTADASVEAATVSESAKDADVASNVQEKRTRKPATRGEIMPLTTKEAPVNLPDWFVLSQTYLEEGLDVKEWRECVEAWVDMEKALGLSEVGAQRLNTKCRPGILSKWLISRKFHALPKVDNASRYAEEWVSWWNSIQPKWRQSSTEGSLPAPISIASKKEDLACLKKGGPSGLVTVMIGLKWWASIRDEDGRWLASVADIKECMAEFVATGRKRKGDEREADTRKKRK